MSLIFEASPDIRPFKMRLEQHIASQRRNVANSELADMYQTSVWAYVAANLWANNVSSIPMQLKHRDGTIIENPSPTEAVYPLWKIVTQNDMKQFLKRTELTLRFWGQSLTVKERNIHGVVRSLNWVNPFLYTPVGNSNQALTEFKLYSGRYQPHPIGKLDITDAVYMVEMVNFDNDSKGTSSAEVVFLQASAATEIAMTQLASFQNLAIPAMIIQPEAPTNGVSMKPSAEDQETLLRFIRRKFMGSVNAGRTLVSKGRWDFKQLSPPWKDIIPVEQEQALRESIAAGFNLPIEFITTGQTNYAELQGKRTLWLETRFVPRVQWYADELTEQLCTSEGFHEYVIVPNFDAVMKELQAARITNVKDKLTSGLVSLGNAQLELGLNVTDGFEELYYYEGIGYMPIGEFTKAWQYKLDPTTLPMNGNLLVSEPGDAPLLTATVEQTQSDTEVSTQFDESMPAVKVFVATPDLLKEITIATRKAYKQQTFEPDQIEPATNIYIRHLIEEGIDREQVQELALSHHAAIKARSAMRFVRAKFERDVDGIFKLAVQGRSTQAGFISALTAVLNSAIEDVAFAGLADGGVKTKELDEDERLFVENHQREQVQYIENVAIAIFEDGRVTEKEARGKADMWWNKSVNPVYMEMIVRASANAAFKRIMGATEKHCIDCEKLHNQVRRAKFWHERKIWNASSVTQCKGFKCECRNVATDEPITRGRFPKISGLVHSHEGES